MDKSTAETLDKSFIKLDIDGVTHELSVGASLDININSAN